MPVNHDDEILPVTPADVATPFVLQPGARTASLFPDLFYPTQGGPARPDRAGELRGLYGEAGALLWKPEWSIYQADRNGKRHWGVDIYGPVGQALIAVVDGELSFRNQPGGLGLYAVLAITVAGKRYEFHYGHLSAAHGAQRSVTKGETIGFIGCSGNADYSHTCSAAPGGNGLTSSHVHFALLPPGTTAAPLRANPLSVLGWTLQTPARPAWL
jgi:murein DD-endopeptidase MepM/ murein hydrolase activator NlpD